MRRVSRPILPLPLKIGLVADTLPHLLPKNYNAKLNGPSLLIGEFLPLLPGARFHHLLGKYSAILNRI